MATKRKRSSSKRHRSRSLGANVKWVSAPIRRATKRHKKYGHGIHTQYAQVALGKHCGVYRKSKKQKPYPLNLGKMQLSLLGPLERQLGVQACKTNLKSKSRKGRKIHINIVAKKKPTAHSRHLAKKKPTAHSRDLAKKSAALAGLFSQD